jgi:hypothetical protein
MTAAVAVAESMLICRTCSTMLERMGRTKARGVQSKVRLLTPAVRVLAVEDLLEMMSLEVVAEEQVDEAQCAVSYGMKARTVARHMSDCMGL